MIGKILTIYQTSVYLGAEAARVVVISSALSYVVCQTRTANTKHVRERPNEAYKKWERK